MVALNISPRMLFPEITALCDPEPHAAAVNMAIDEMLLRDATGPLLRVYRWAQPSVSFGYFGDVNAVAARWPGRELVRRWTGGGEVLHGDDCTYTLIIPRPGPLTLLRADDSYRAIHECLARFLRDAEMIETAPLGAGPACFESPVRFDVVACGRKVAGAAQRRTGRGLLHQGSILGLAEEDATAARLGQMFATVVRPRSLSGAELQAGLELAAEKYATDAWLRRFPRR